MYGAAKGNFAPCGARPEALPLDSAAFVKAGETFNMRSIQPFITPTVYRAKWKKSTNLFDGLLVLILNFAQKRLENPVRNMSYCPLTSGEPSNIIVPIFYFAKRNEGKSIPPSASQRVPAC